MRELHRGCADAGACRVDEHSLAHLQRCPGKERIVRGDENFRKGCGRREVERRRNSRQAALRHNDKLRLSATSSDATDAVADFPAASRFA